MRYEPSFPATVPYESPIYVPETDEDMYTYQANLEYAVAGPSHTSIASEANCSADEARQHLLRDKESVAPVDETSIHPGVASPGRYHSYKGKEREAQSNGAPYQNRVAVKIEPTEPRVPEWNSYNTVPDVEIRFLSQRRKGIPPPLDLAPASAFRRNMYRSTPQVTVWASGYPIPYGESRAYRHRRTQTFDYPPPVSPGRYETHATYWKWKLSEEFEDGYTRSRKRSRRN